jgi:hypothetical protein
MKRLMIGFVVWAAIGSLVYSGREASAQPAVRNHHLHRLGRRLLLPQWPGHAAKALQRRVARRRRVHLWEVH